MGEENSLPESGIVGVADHTGWAVPVVASHSGLLLDRRRVALVDEHLPKLPHHHECQMLPVEQAVELVDQVRASARHHARISLDDVAAAVDAIPGIAIRQCPTLPPTTVERIQSYYAQTRADTVMYREALAEAAAARGWRVHWYDPRKVLDLARRALRVESLDPHFTEVKRSAGAPWGQDHRIAMAAAIAVMHSHSVDIQEFVG